MSNSTTTGKATKGRRADATKARRRPAPASGPADRGDESSEQPGKKPRRSKWNRTPPAERVEVLDAAEAAVLRLAEALYGKRGRGWKRATLIIVTTPDDRPDFAISFPR